MGAFSIVSVVSLLLFLALLVLAVHKRWYVQVALVAVAAMSVALFVLGVGKLVDSYVGTDAAGAVLAASGTLLLLSAAVSARLLFFRRPAQAD